MSVQDRYDRALVVLVERLDEDAGGTFGGGLYAGRPERDPAHPEIVEVEPQAGLLGRPELRLEEAEIGVEVAAPEEVLEAPDEIPDRLGSRRGVQSAPKRPKGRKDRTRKIPRTALFTATLL